MPPATNLNKREEIHYLFGVAFTNRTMLEELEEAKRLAKQAGKIANKALQKQERDNDGSLRYDK